MHLSKEQKKDHNMTSKQKTDTVKTFILDTSVMLYDKCSIHSFKDNKVIIPLVALDELDRFKDKKGVIGENARYVNRFLDGLRAVGNLHSGIKLENGQTIKVDIKTKYKVPVGLEASLPDNQMIGLALELTQKKDKPIIMVTKDINFRVKCDALGITAEDYSKDKINLEDDSFYRGFVDVELESDSPIVDMCYNDLEKSNCLIVDSIEADIGRDLYENEFVCLKAGSQSFLGFYKKEKLYKLKSSDDMSGGIAYVKERNREQLYALNLLNDDDIPLVSITGLAGSGKTYLTLLAGIEGLHAGKYRRIVITRNVQPVGRDIGFLPGDLNDKMMPWIAPIMDNFRQGLKDNDLTFFSAMKEKGDIEIAPLAFMRGRTFADTFLIMDEAQNCTIHELKTVITRMGENSKIVLLGDVDQIDTPYIDSQSNGLTIVSEKFKKEKVAGHVQLKKGERSYLSSIAAEII
jgi:PhoH-like ATPase